MEDKLHPIDFVDYQAVFSEALTRLGKGTSVSEAVESCLRERYPLTYRDINAEAGLILSCLKQEREWGSVRALRELSDRPGLAEEIRIRLATHDEPTAAQRLRRPAAIADYPKIFALAQRKRQSGFSLEDSLEMAVRELYPQTFRKAFEAAVFYVRLASERLQVHELRAMRELAENPGFFLELEGSLPA